VRSSGSSARTARARPPPSNASFYRAPADWRSLLEVLGLAGKSDMPFRKLARNQIVAQQLRVDQANLEDAFLELTGKHAEEA
jgi:hypothetical protein